ncbi:MAG: DegT/DnrJ/EryC1/StrS family aminotransferase [bacterium]
MIPLSEPVLGQAEKKWIAKCLRSGFVSSAGPMVTEFESRFAAMVGSKWAVATSSGTAALHVTLHALGIGSGDSVAVPDLTFVASLNPVLFCGAEPLLLDVDPATWCMDLALLRSLCASRRNSKRIKAVVPVHLYGCACDMVELRRIALEYDLLIVEDATEALGTTLHGKQLGTFGTAGCFSFNGNKLLTTGAGGMVVTDSEQLAAKIRYLVNQARDNPVFYLHGAMGFNYRMDSLSAALGIAQLTRFETILRRKQAIAARYNKVVRHLPGLQSLPVQNGVTHSYWMYSVVLQNVTRRDAWLKALNKANIAARPFFHPLHRQPYVNSRLWTRGPRGARQSQQGVSDILAAGGINLPSSAGLKKNDQDTVLQCLQTLACRT